MELYVNLSDNCQKLHVDLYKTLCEFFQICLSVPQKLYNDFVDLLFSFLETVFGFVINCMWFKQNMHAKLLGLYGFKQSSVWVCQIVSTDFSKYSTQFIKSNMCFFSKPSVHLANVACGLFKRSETNIFYIDTRKTLPRRAEGAVNFLFNQAPPP